MLFPKKIQYKKHFKGKVKGQTTKGSKIIFGNFALKSLEINRLNSNQIEAARKVISKKIKKLGFLWIRIFPDIPVTSKPTENRMGKGKGSFNFWVAKIKKGQILFEMSGIQEDLAIQIFQIASKKLPLKTKVIKK